MKTTEIKRFKFNGESLLVTSDGQIIRKKKWPIKHTITSGTATDRGYRTFYINGKAVRAHRLIAMAFLPEYSEHLSVDHINGIKHDNRLENLRMATASENNMGSRKITGLSRYRGVYLNKKTGRWVAQARKNHKKYTMGSFVTEEEAATAYNKKIKTLGFPKEALNTIQ